MDALMQEDEKNEINYAKLKKAEDREAWRRGERTYIYKHCEPEAMCLPPATQLSSCMHTS